MNSKVKKYWSFVQVSVEDVDVERAEYNYMDLNSYPFMFAYRTEMTTYESKKFLGMFLIEVKSYYKIPNEEYSMHCKAAEFFNLMRQANLAAVNIEQNYYILTLTCRIVGPGEIREVGVGTTIRDNESKYYKCFDKARCNGMKF